MTSLVTRFTLFAPDTTSYGLDNEREESVDGELRKWLQVTLLLELVLGHKSSTHGQNLGIMNDIVPKRIEQNMVMNSHSPLICALG